MLYNVKYGNESDIMEKTPPINVYFPISKDKNPIHKKAINEG